MLWVLTEALYGDPSNEYPQHMFLQYGEIRKISAFFDEKYLQ